MDTRLNPPSRLRNKQVGRILILEDPQWWKWWNWTRRFHVSCVPEEKLSKKHMEPRSDGKNGTRLHHLSWTCQVARGDVTVDTPRSAPQGRFFRRMVSISVYHKKKNAAPCSVSCKPTWTDPLLLIFKLLKLRLLAHSVFVPTKTWHLFVKSAWIRTFMVSLTKCHSWSVGLAWDSKSFTKMQILWPHFYSFPP